MDPPSKQSLPENSLKPSKPSLPENSLTVPAIEQLKRRRSSTPEEEKALMTEMVSRWRSNSKASGMTQEQLIEFTKQQTVTRCLQDKIRELDSKLAEADAAIKSCHQKTAELTENEAKDASDLFEAINNVNTTMSEKLAQQRVEVQKLAEDTPISINYDPFNYGEAYHGDVTDFQARQRIVEVKETMKTIMSAIKDMQDAMTFSPYNDLGYRVVRLDTLIHEADRLITERDKDVVVVQQSPGHRGPDNTTRFPRAEIFQAAPSQYGITDAIQQTMYRLEMELAGIREAMDGMDMKTAYTTIDELKANMRTLKETAVDQKTTRKIVKEMTAEAARGAGGRASRSESLAYLRGSIGGSSLQCQSITTDKFKEAFDRLNRSVNSLNIRLKALERKEAYVSESTPLSRRKVSPQQRECDTEELLHPRGFRNSPMPTNVKPKMVAACSVHHMSYHPGFGSRLGQLPKYAAYTPPPRLRYVMKKGYQINVNNQVVGVYHLDKGLLPTLRPREPLPRITTSCTARNAPPYQNVSTPEDHLVRGRDGKLYMADPRRPSILKLNKEGQQNHQAATFTTTKPSASPSGVLPSVSITGVRRYSAAEAATQIQAGYRGMLARKSIQKEHKAAAKIQAGFRGMKTRRDSQPEKMQADGKPEVEKDVKPQAKDDGEEDIDIDLTDPEVEKTALMMQKRFKFGKNK